MLVAAAIAPHGDLDDAPATRAGLRELGRRLGAAGVDTTIVLTPHNVHVDGHFAVVTSARIGAHPADPVLARGLLDSLATAGVPAVGVSFGGNDPAESEMPIDWGTEIPLAHVPASAVVVVSPARDRPLEEHVTAGAAIPGATANRRVALVASADHGHAHDPDGPYGLDPAAAEYDRLVQELVRANRLDRLGELAGLAGAAKADSLWQLLMLAGALGEGWTATLLSYERPAYYGMLTAVFER